jgi:hypothetical protein
MMAARLLDETSAQRGCRPDENTTMVKDKPAGLSGRAANTRHCSDLDRW